MLQIMVLPVAIAILSPFFLAMKANMDRQASQQKMFLRNQLKMSELSQALLDEGVCTQNLRGKPANAVQSVGSFFYLNAAGVLDTAKKIMAPRYLDAAKTQLNPDFDATGVEVVRLIPPSSLAGSAPGDAMIAYLEVEMNDSQSKVRSIPIYFEYDASNTVSRCSARRRVASCP